MFGFDGGESADTVARNKSYMKDAQQKWPFLISFDFPPILAPHSRKEIS
jgi:hypothetical protein